MRNIMLLTLAALMLINTVTALTITPEDLKEAAGDYPIPFYLEGTEPITIDEDSQVKVVIGSDLDLIEQELYDRVKGELDRLPANVEIVEDTNPGDLEGYKLFIVGGPESNLVAAQMAAKRASNQPGVQGVINENMIMIGSTYSYPSETGGLTEPLTNQAAGMSVAATAAAAVPIAAGSGALGNLFGFLQGGVEEYAEERLQHRTHKRRKQNQVLAVLAGTVFMGAAIAYADYKAIFLEALPYSIASAGVGIIGHEVAHWLAARAMKVDSYYSFWPTGAILLGVTSYFFGNAFAAPGATHIEGSDSKQGKAMLAGPVFNLLLAGGILLAAPLLPAEAITPAITINLTLACYHMMPFRPMDGKEIWEWRKSVWLITFLACIASYAWLVVLR